MRSFTLAMLAGIIIAGQGPQAFAQAKATAPKKETPKSASAEVAVSADEQLIRQAITKFVDLYNAHKPSDIASLFAADARIVFRNGTEVNGRDEITKSFEVGFADNPKCAISVVVDSIRFVTPDVAVEEGYTSDFPDGETLAARSRYTVLHLKRDGKWTMQSTRVEEEESLSAYSDLRVLEWLVGDWIDEGKAENVESTFRWDENKSFLLEDFKVIRDGAVVLKGTQRIGWDPQAKQIRSWIFDSAGGFGEAAWTQVGDVWACKSKGISADGVSTSATRVLQKATDNRVIWTSRDRIAGNEVMPDISVTMVRKAPESK